MSMKDWEEEQRKQAEKMSKTLPPGVSLQVWGGLAHLYSQDKNDYPTVPAPDDLTGRFAPYVNELIGRAEAAAVDHYKAKLRATSEEHATALNHAVTVYAGKGTDAADVIRAAKIYADYLIGKTIEP